MKKFITFSLALALILGNTSAYAESITHTATSGGYWSFTSFDESEFDEITLYKGKPMYRVNTVAYLSPDQVASIAGYLLGEELNANIIDGVKTAILLGSTEGSKFLIAKYGTAAVASTWIPVVNVIGWTATGLMIFDAFFGQDYYFNSHVASAAEENKGLIVVSKTGQDRRGAYAYDTRVIYFWDSSSIYGNYPHAITPLGHNGSFTKN